jgi:osmoprotectant transport system permease protein
MRQYATNETSPWPESFPGRTQAVIGFLVQLLTDTWQFFLANQPDFWDKVLAHLALSGVALLIGVLVAIPVGIATAHHRLASGVVSNGIGAVRAIPSLAIMAVMLPFIGIGFWPALIALTILAIPPILINTQAGILSIDPAIREAALGMGMDPAAIVRDVELPLAAPVIVAGVRTATVEVLASATLGSIIGAGGLGEYVFAGLSLGPAYLYIMLVGAITVALMAFVAEYGLNRLEALFRRNKGQA